MLSKPNVMFPSKPQLYAAHPVPSLDEWRGVWKVWDTVTRQMIPEEEIGSKPIKLRNACIFYLGHIPTFLDMKITESTKWQPTEPAAYHGIFERGIDPDVDNPEQCHAHSAIPDEWPPLDDILQYQQRVRARVTDMYASGLAYEDSWAGRVLWLGLEHEIMHLETLLYMLLQSEKTLAPPDVVKPDFEQLADQSSNASVENEWFDVPKQTVALGLHDPDAPEGPLRHFGWDVEKPLREAEVKAFKAKARPITNGEYAKYLVGSGIGSLPVSWTTAESASRTNGTASSSHELQAFLDGKAVRTVFGSVPLKYALDWPMSASYDELAGCAKYMGGRIPTMEEARSIYEYADAIKTQDACQALGSTIPAVNGHLVNEGVEESPPAKRSAVKSSGTAAGPSPSDSFVSLDQANVGFKHWHPMPVTPDGGRLAGQGEMGGLWEWTSSVLEQQDGFEPMKLYPAYSGESSHRSCRRKRILTSYISRFLRWQAQYRPRGLVGDPSADQWAQVLVSPSLLSRLDARLSYLRITQCQLVPTQLSLRLGWGALGEGRLSDIHSQV